LSDKGIIDALQEFGLSKREAEAYIFLSKKGAQGVRSVATILRMDRVQVYRTLKSLQEKGVVEATLEAPTRFTAIPFETLIESLIKTRKSKVAELEAEKDSLIDYWKSLSSKTPEYPIAKFRVLMEQRGIYDEINRMLNQTKKEFLELTTGLGVVKEDLAGISDAIIDSARKNPKAEFKILANISKETYVTIRQIIKKTTARNLNVQWRHIDSGSRLYPQFVLRDGEETILYVASGGDELPMVTQAVNGLCISSEIFVSTLRESFMEMWHNAITAEQRIKELETGKPVEQSTIIRDAKEAQTKLEKALEAAEKDVIAITSSDGINTISKDNLFAKHSKRAIRFRIMAPIDLDNLEAARKLSELCETRHVPITYLNMILSDGQHLFMFKAPSFDSKTVKSMFNFEEAFYTNDTRYVERVSEMLNDMWKRGVDINELTAGPVDQTNRLQVSCSDTVSKIVDMMLKNNVNSVIVTENNHPMGIISERDLLEKVVKPRKHPAKICAREIMSMPVVTIESNKPLVEALKTMRSTGIRNLAVFRDGRLVGMLKLNQPTTRKA